MIFFNDRELAIRFKNNQVSSQERLLYYIIPLIFYALGYLILIGFIYSIIATLISFSPADIFQGDILKEIQQHLNDIKEYYSVNANRTLSEIFPKETFDSFISSFDTFIHSNIPIKDMEYFTQKNEFSYVLPVMVIDFIINYTLPIIGVVICYKTNKLGDDKEFLERFISLSFPVVIRSCLIAIPFYIIDSLVPENTFMQLIDMPYLAFLAYFYWRLNTSIKIASSGITP